MGKLDEARTGESLPYGCPIRRGRGIFAGLPLSRTNTYLDAACKVCNPNAPSTTDEPFTIAARQTRIF